MMRPGKATTLCCPSPNGLLEHLQNHICKHQFSSTKLRHRSHERPNAFDNSKLRLLLWIPLSSYGTRMLRCGSQTQPRSFPHKDHALQLTTTFQYTLALIAHSQKGPPSLFEKFLMAVPKTRLMIAVSFMTMFNAGPEVSLSGSPTVSPVTEFLCASEPLR